MLSRKKGDVKGISPEMNTGSLGFSVPGCAGIAGRGVAVIVGIGVAVSVNPVTA
jgi:hypothetical protein